MATGITPTTELSYDGKSRAPTLMVLKRNRPKPRFTEPDRLFWVTYSKLIKRWQNPFCERLIGSIRRDCLDHVIIFNEQHLRSVLNSYFDYYYKSRCHLLLDQDSPEPRPIQSPEQGKFMAIPKAGG